MGGDGVARLVSLLVDFWRGMWWVLVLDSRLPPGLGWRDCWWREWEGGVVAIGEWSRGLRRRANDMPPRWG